MDDLISLHGHNKHKRKHYVCSDLGVAEMVESSEYYDTIFSGSFKVPDVYKPPSAQWSDVPLPNNKHPAIYIWAFLTATKQPGDM
jgi:hypothetical protein